MGDMHRLGAQGRSVMWEGVGRGARWHMGRGASEDSTARLIKRSNGVQW